MQHLVLASFLSGKQIYGTEFFLRYLPGANTDLPNEGPIAKRVLADVNNVSPLVKSVSPPAASALNSIDFLKANSKNPDAFDVMLFSLLPVKDDLHVRMTNKALYVNWRDSILSLMQQFKIMAPFSERFPSYSVGRYAFIEAGNDAQIRQKLNQHGFGDYTRQLLSEGNITLEQLGVLNAFVSEYNQQTPENQEQWLKSKEVDETFKQYFDAGNLTMGAGGQYIVSFSKHSQKECLVLLDSPFLRSEHERGGISVNEIYMVAKKMHEVASRKNDPNQAAVTIPKRLIQCLEANILTTEQFKSLTEEQITNFDREWVRPRIDAGDITGNDVLELSWTFQFYLMLENVKLN